MRGPIWFVAVLLALAGMSTTARAQILIDPTFESSITSNANAAEIEATINAAISNIEAVISSPITVNIDFGSMSGGLGESETYIGQVSYSSYLAQLAGSASTAQDAMALSYLPVQANNPVNGDPDIQASLPLLRALGYIGADAPAGQPDGFVNLNLSLMNLSPTGPQNPSLYSLESVVTHEMDEVLGIGGDGSTLNYANQDNSNVTTGIPVGVLDLDRYSAAAIRSFTTSGSSTAYFSIDGGTTDLSNFNQNSGGDYADWATGASPQVQDAYGSPGSSPTLGVSETTALDVVGYTLTAQGLALENGLQISDTPEPSVVCLFSLGLIGLGLHHRRQQAARRAS